MNLTTKIMDNNKLLAEFLGWQFSPEDKRFEDWYDANGNRMTFGNHIPLAFDTDWNWLMQVVEKINDLNNVVHISENNVKIVNNTRGEVIVEVTKGSMIESTYTACIYFVKWYNLNK